MIKKLKTAYYSAGASIVLGLMMAKDANASNNFSKIADNVITSVQDLPGLLSGLAYMFGLILGVLGILKIKDHVENPGQTPLKDGAIRLAAGGALFAFPIVTEAMFLTTGDGGNAAKTATMKTIELGI